MQSNQDSEIDDSGVNLPEIDSDLEENLEERTEEFFEELTPGIKEIYSDEETGEVTIKAQEPVKWLGFIKGKATKRFEMDDKGNVNERAPWYSFIYTEDTEE